MTWLPTGGYDTENWDPPEGWKYPFLHNKSQYFTSVAQTYVPDYGEPVPDLSAYAQW